MIKINNCSDILATNNSDYNVYFDIPRIIAEYGTRLLWGQGFNFTHKNKDVEKKIKQILRRLNADLIFQQASQIASLAGRSIIVIDYLDNQIQLTIADPFINAKVAEAFNEEEAIVYWYRPLVGNAAYGVKVKSTRYKNEYTAFCNGEQIDIDELNVKLDKNKQIPKEWKHNFGFVPAVVVYNKPKNYIQLSQLSHYQLADTFNCRDLPKQINFMINEIIKESYMSHSRVFASFTPDFLRKMKEDIHDSTEQILMSRFFVSTSLSDKQGFDIQKSTFDGETRWNVVKALFDRVIRESGYSPANDTISERTATETLFNKSGDIETTKMKRNIQQQAISLLLAKIMVIIGIYDKVDFENYLTDADDDWTFEIKENMVLNAIQQSEQLFLMYQRNQISYYEMIAKLRDIDIDEAKTIADEIMKDNNKIMSQQIDSLNLENNAINSPEQTKKDFTNETTQQQNNKAHNKV